MYLLCVVLVIVAVIAFHDKNIISFLFFCSLTSDKFSDQHVNFSAYEGVKCVPTLEYTGARILC